MNNSEKRKTRDCFEKADKRDSGDGLNEDEILYKQNVTKCVQISDIAINNEEDWLELNKNTDDIEINIMEFCRKL